MCLPHGDRGKRNGKPAFPAFPLTHRGLTGALATRCNPQTQGLLRGLEPHLFLQVRPICARLPTQPRGLRGTGDRRSGSPRERPFCVLAWKGLRRCLECSWRRGFVPLIDNEYQKGHIYIRSWVGIVCVLTAGQGGASHKQTASSSLCLRPPEVRKRWGIQEG